MEQLNQNKLQELLNYDPTTGKWMWRNRPEMPANWNARYAGRPAGSICPSKGYLRIVINGKTRSAHRLAFLYMTGEFPTGEIDHENLIKSDCRWTNLRLATSSQNNSNKKIQRNNTIGFKGILVDRSKEKIRYGTQLVVNGMRIKKWGFESPAQAHEYYKVLVEKYHGEFGRVA